MTTVWSRAPGVPWRRVVDGAVLLPPAGDEPLVVTGPGAVVWELLATPGDVASLAERISSRFGVSADQVAEDIAPFLEALAERSMITGSGTTG